MGQSTSFMLAGDLDSALKDLSKTIELKPEFAIAYMARGKIYDSFGDSKKAQADFKKAKELGYDEEDFESMLDDIDDDDLMDEDFDFNRLFRLDDGADYEEIAEKPVKTNVKKPGKKKGKNKKKKK